MSSRAFVLYATHEITLATKLPHAQNWRLVNATFTAEAVCSCSSPARGSRTCLLSSPVLAAYGVDVGLCPVQVDGSLCKLAMRNEGEFEFRIAPGDVLATGNLYCDRCLPNKRQVTEWLREAKNTADPWPAALPTELPADLPTPKKRRRRRRRRKRGAKCKQSSTRTDRDGRKRLREATGRRSPDPSRSPRS